MPAPDAVRLAIWRGLDGLLYTGVALLLLLAYLLSGRRPTEFPDTLLCLPVLAVTWACWQWPAVWPGQPNWAPRILALRVSALVTAALSAPAIWWLNFPYQPWLLANFLLGLLAGVSTALQVVLALDLLAQAQGWRRVRLATMGLRFPVLYLMGIPVVSVSVAGTILGLYNRMPIYEALLVLNMVVPAWAMHLPLLPLALLLLIIAWVRHLPLTELLPPPEQAEAPAHV